MPTIIRTMASTKGKDMDMDMDMALTITMHPTLRKRYCVAPSC